MNADVFGVQMSEFCSQFRFSSPDAEDEYRRELWRLVRDLPGPALAKAVSAVIGQHRNRPSETIVANLTRSFRVHHGAVDRYGNPLKPVPIVSQQEKEQAAATLAEWFREHRRPSGNRRGEEGARD